jgi:hypothetical protein
VLTVPPPTTLNSLGLIRQGADLGTLLLTEDLAGDGRTLECGAGGHLVAVDEQNGLKLHVRTDLLGSKVHTDDLALGDAFLGCSYTDDGVHKGSILAELERAGLVRGPS